MRALAVLLLALLASAAHARGDLREIRPGEPVALRADRAYVLFRVPRIEGVVPNSPVFLRIPAEAELERYQEARRRAFAAAEPGLTRRHLEALRRRERDEPAPPAPSLETFDYVDPDLANVHFVDSGRPFLRGPSESVYLVEAVPGDYVLYGLRYGNGTGALNVCMCLGTVGFRAEAGLITDLGYFLSDRVNEPSALPELRAESGLGPSSYGMFILWGATVRPVRPDSSMPDTLRPLAVRPAAYRAVGRYVEPRAMAINRLAPVPGILDYRDGRVVDGATGRDVPDAN